MNTGKILRTMTLALSFAMYCGGCGSSSSSSTQDTQAPTAPTYLTAVAASDTKITLRWVAASDDVGLSAYEVLRDGANLASVLSNTTLFNDTTVLSSTAHTYQVRARDAAGFTSAYSSSATATTFAAGSGDIKAPDTPKNLEASVGSTSIILTWTAATDTGGGVSGYYIYRGTSAGDLKLYASTSTNTYEDKVVTHGSTYYYKVTAVDGVPNESGYDSIKPALFN